MIALFVVAGIVLYGIVWASDKAMPWLFIASRVAFDICILIFLPLCIFRKTRPWAGLGFYYASYVFGIVLFAYSCLFAFSVWGFTGLIVGLVFAGIGVVPVALLAALFHAEWSVLLELVFGILFTFGFRALGIWLAIAKPKQMEAEVY